jgi:hypothetical protein
MAPNPAAWTSPRNAICIIRKPVICRSPDSIALNLHRPTLYSDILDYDF